MLRPAILYKEEIINKFRERFYTDDMLYETGCNENWSPEIYDCPNENTFQYAITDKANNCIGFVGFKVDWYLSSAYNFGLLSFDKGNVTIGYALKEVINDIKNKYHLHRMEWRMVGGNPAERSYDNFCKKYNGTKHIFRDAVRDRYGKYHDDIVYEIIFD